MISKVITGKTFEGTCRYICSNENRAIVLETEGVRGHHYKLMAADFEDQRSLRPSLSKAVFHAILSFHPTEKIDDARLVEIAREYLQKMGIADTQFSISKHTDRNHPHLHVIANLINDKGETIKDSWIGLRGKKVAQQLTIQYGLIQAIGKNLELTHLERLNEKEANRYAIYTAILEKLPVSKNLDDLKVKLQKGGIDTLYKYKGETNELQGISFRIGDYKYKGIEVDRQFSVKNLKRVLQQQQNVPRFNQIRPSLSKDDKSNQIDLQRDHQQKNESILEQLIKPEYSSSGQLPSQWQMNQKPKKKK
jgi:hypothetical protein